MKLKLIYILLIGFFFSQSALAIDPISKIAKANKAKELAKEAYVNGEYNKAIQHYSYLLDSLNYESEEAQLNRAHSYFQLKDTINAFDNYRSLSTAKSKSIQSKAFLQMGNLSEQQKEYENALSYFKEALKTNPANQEARYNYELLKKKMKEQEENQDQDQKDQQDQDKEQQDKKEENKDQESKEDQDSESQKDKKDQEKSQEDKEAEKDQQKKDAEDSEGEEGEKSEEEKKKEQEQKEGEESESEDQKPMEPSTREKLEEMNVSEEKAKMILEALRNKEAQYFQQMRKKATERPKSGKPDW